MLGWILGYSHHRIGMVRHHSWHTILPRVHASHRAMVPQQWFLGAFLVFNLFQLCTSTDTISPTHSITGNETLVSKGENFALGIFKPGNSTHQYIGIWYNKVPEQTVVWVANRDNPIQDSNVALMINDDGNLILLDGDRKTPLWSTNISTSINNTTAKLLDSGNLVLNSSPSGTLLWQSFDHPTHIWLAGMKLGLNLKTGLRRSLTSWKSKDDPASGDYSFCLDPRGSPQFFLYMGSTPIYRTGPWNGRVWSGVPFMTKADLIKDSFVSQGDEISLTYTILNSSIFSIFVVNGDGTLQRRTLIDRTRSWHVFLSTPKDVCDDYRECGPYGCCNASNARQCECLRGFEPKSPGDWSLNDWSGGCVRKRRLECGKGEGFLKLEQVKLPDTSTSRVDMSLSLKDCEKECLRNCNCTGYAGADITGGGSGCIAWYGDLVDIRVIPGGGQDLYVRLDAADLEQERRVSKGFLGKKRTVVILILSIVVGVFFLVLSVYFVMKKRKRKGEIENHQCHGRLLFDLTSRSTSFKDSLGAKELEGSGTYPDLSLFELNVIVAATNNFSSSHKLGQGGFGCVYKGRLVNGQEIAVKRLSKNSGQGIEELKNEVTLIAKLQHRNLVRLLGYYIQEEEKMLIYEYMPNKSLDTVLFDRSRKTLLDWKKRFEIIIGIARGILYLHRDSRLRIIHRDLKASNVLLDAEMTPKISDFGMARIFGGNQSQANTKRVVGTYGYMSPEYAMEGQFSIKSDVYSFGVLLLEIISGKKNNDYYHEDPSLNLIGYAWELWKESRVWNIVDSTISDLCPAREVLRCIQVAFLCVQESALDRPTMSEVVFMLGNETTMPSPNRPAFIMRRPIKDPTSSSTGAGSGYVNEMMITEVEAR